MKRVILESPYAGKDDTEVCKNKIYARACMQDCLRKCESPMVSHLLYTQVLDDKSPTQRAIGMTAGFAWYEVADCCVVYTDYGISEGMIEGIEFAREKGLPIIYRNIYDGK